MQYVLRLKVEKVQRGLLFFRKQRMLQNFDTCMIIKSQEHWYYVCYLRLEYYCTTLFIIFAHFTINIYYFSAFSFSSFLFLFKSSFKWIKNRDLEITVAGNYFEERHLSSQESFFEFRYNFRYIFTFHSESEKFQISHKKGFQIDQNRDLEIRNLDVLYSSQVWFHFKIEYFSLFPVMSFW